MLPQMLQKLKKPSGAAPDTAQFDPSEFIPFAGFYDATTLLTKNGELATMLRIECAGNGLINEVGGRAPQLRDIIRQALKECVDSDTIALWCHTSRKRQRISVSAPTGNAFTREMDAYWQSIARFTHSYRNVVTLTLLHQGQDTRLFDMADFKRGKSINSNRNYRQQVLDENAKHLKSVAEGIANALSVHFQVRTLGFVEREISAGKAAFYAEPLEFLATLTALREMPMPVQDSDLSHQLYSHKLIFGYNALEARGEGGKRFGAVLSLKHYHELPASVLDMLLQQPFEMTVAESIEYIPAEEAVREHQALAEIYKTSQDATIAKVSGTSAMFEAFNNRPSNYAKHQINILIAADDLATVDAGCTALQNAANKLGLVLIREEIRLEESFWAMLPGNFPFLRRQYPTHAGHLAAFARLNYFPIGHTQGPWGVPICVFPTKTHTPYLFHFHAGTSGHTMFLDYNSFPDSIGTRALNLLITQTLKSGHRVVAVEQSPRHEQLAHALRGAHTRLHGQDGVTLNPLHLEDSPRNRGFLTAWLAFVLQLDAEDIAGKEAIKVAVDAIFQQGIADKGLADIASQLVALGASTLGGRLRDLLAHPAFASVFAASATPLDWSANFTCVLLDKTTTASMATASAFALLLHQFIHTLDGKPTLLVLSDGFELCNNAFVAPRLQSLLAMLDQQNVAVVFTSATPEIAASSSVVSTIASACATRFLVPDDVPVQAQEVVFQLSASAVQFWQQQDRQKGECVIVHGQEVIPIYLPVDWPDQLQSVLDNHATSAHEAFGR